MHAIALVSCGHHWTFLSVSFLQFCSAFNLAQVVSLSMFSNLHCWAHVSLWPMTCSSKICIWCCRFWLVSSFSNSRLYLATILGSSHLSLLAFSGTVSGGANHPSTPTGMLIQAAQWLLGMPSLNAKYPEVIVWIRSGWRNIPSICLLLQLCMLGVFGPCCVVIASANPICVTAALMGLVCTSSFISTRIITWSPASLHCWTCSWRSMSIWGGTSYNHCPFDCRPVVDMLLDTHLTYKDDTMWQFEGDAWFSLPCKQIQLHQLRLEISSPV